VGHNRSIVAGRKCLQGNLDPCTLFAPAEKLVARTNAMLEAFAGQPLIANLGHGMMPTHTPEQLQTYLDTVYAWKL
jgi:uroporphyrinogen decarboxylase